MKSLFTLISFLAVMAFVGCKAHKPASAKTAPAKLESRKDGQFPSVVLSEAAEQRLGIVTTKATSGPDGTSVPSSAVLYDVDGSVWVYVRTNTRTYGRTPIALKRVDGKLAKLLTSFPVDIEVVTEGAAELFGTETGGGK